jgi:hypothetical protein
MKQWVLREKKTGKVRLFETESSLSAYLSGSGQDREWDILVDNTKGIQKIGSWFPFRFNPMTPDYLSALDAQPMGILPMLGIPSEEPSLKPLYKKHEIEMALQEGDLHAWEVQELMDMLPNVQPMYEYLEEKGKHKTALLIRRLLSF